MSSIKLQKIITLLPPYSLIVSLLYLFGFWGTFNIDVLEYISLSDVIKSALYPLTYSSIFIVLGVAIGNVFNTSLVKAMPVGDGQYLPIAKYIRWLFRLLELILVILALYVIFFEVGNTRWHTVAVLLSFTLVRIVVNADFASECIKNKQERDFIVIILSIILLNSYGWGAKQAERVTSSEQVIKINGKKSEKKYIGWAGDFLILWDSSKSTVSVKSKSTIKSLELFVPIESSMIDLLYEKKLSTK